MTRVQFLLLKVAEECCEIAVRASKAAQFGLEEKQEGQDQTNAERLHGEFTDLLAVMTMLDDETALPSLEPEDCAGAIRAKIQKVNIFWDYATSLGFIEARK